MDVGPGDRVICVRSGDVPWMPGKGVYAGRVYVIDRVQLGVDYAGNVRPGFILTADETRSFSRHGVALVVWSPDRFRKLPDISEWLEASTDFEEPKRTPAPAKPSKVTA